MPLFRLMPFSPTRFVVDGPVHVIATAHPQMPFRPRYLFITPADQLLVTYIGIGADRGGTVSAGELPAKLFELRSLAVAMADMQTLVDEMSRAAYERKETPHEVVIKVDLPIDERCAWPLPLELPVCRPGIVVTVGLRTETSEHGFWPRVVHLAMAGDHIEDVPRYPMPPRRPRPVPRLTGDAEIDELLNPKGGDE